MWQSILRAANHFLVFDSAALNDQPLLRNPTTSSQDNTCGNVELSCHNSSAVENLCCFNAPGGTLLLTQFWDTHPPTGPSDSWTLHGLWPDNCDGTYEAYCDDARNYRNISGILQESSSNSVLDYMRTFWKDYNGDDEHFWQHEWGKHGTCVSTLEPSCFDGYTRALEVPSFFEKAVSLFKDLPTFQWLLEAGIEPSSSKTYTFEQIETALSSKFHNREVRLGCHYGQLNEIWYFYNVRGSLQSGDFVPTDRIGSRSTCPQSGIRYLPKVRGPGPTETTTARRPTTTPQPPGKAFVGRGELSVVHNGNARGCVISKGTWYVSGTCATFVAGKAGDSITLKSSKGPCAVIDGALMCGSGIAPGSFEANGRWLSFNGSTTFSADNLPHGRRMEKLYTGSSRGMSVQIAWT